MAAAPHALAGFCQGPLSDLRSRPATQIAGATRHAGVSLRDVPYSALDGHTDWRQAKLASRGGMGACQGRVCGGTLQHMFGWQPSAPRPPFNPARIETLLCLDDTSPI